MKVKKTDLDDLLVFEPKVFGDERGYFLESWNKKRYLEAGLEYDFLQDNVSFSRYGVLRGLHFQNPYGQGKLICVLEGEVFDVAVDLRFGSPNFGKSFSIILSGKEKNQLFVPPGFAHGFCVTSETALFTYKCTEEYHPEVEHSLLWNDPSLGIDWPVKDPILSEKDAKGIKLQDFSEGILPSYENKI